MDKVTVTTAELEASLRWSLEQAEGIMANTAGAATTHGDGSGALEMCNSMASDIAINLQQAIEATRQAEEQIKLLREALEDLPGCAKAAAYGCGLDSRLAQIISDTVEKICRQALEATNG